MTSDLSFKICRINEPTCIEVLYPVHVSVLKDHSGMFFRRALCVKPSLAFSLHTHFTPETPGFPSCVCVGWPAWVFPDDPQEVWQECLNGETRNMKNSDAGEIKRVIRMTGEWEDAREINFGYCG